MSKGSQSKLTPVNERMLDGLAEPERRAIRARLDEALAAAAEQRERAERMAEELAHAERRRSAAEVRFRNAFEHAPIGVALVAIGNGESGILEANRAMCVITGLEPGEILGSTFEELTAEEDRTLDSDQRRQLLAGEIDAYTVEKRCRHSEGHMIWCQISVSLAPGDEGEDDYGIVQVQDISGRRRFEERLRYLADHDSLTGLLNRRQLLTMLEQQISLDERYGGRSSILILDIDEFKRVNDTFGHRAGDDLIRRVAGILHQRVRGTDTVARLAGDEFAALMPHTDLAGALQVAEELRREVSERTAAEDEAGEVTVSIGVTSFGGEPPKTAEAVLVEADQAMYRAKVSGRDRTELVAGLDVAGHLTERALTTSARVRDALTRRKLSLHSQPIFNLRTGEPERHELLLRMSENGGEPAWASTFIEEAERAGLVQELDRWVVAEALDLVAEQQRGGRRLAVHVNLSGASVTDFAVLEHIERALDEGEADPSQLTFEITETAAIHDFEAAARFADRLTEFGCQVAIDDCGAGHRPFHYLRHLPFDLIKIDGDFVRDLPRSDVDQYTVQAMVGIARGLGKRTIAEFVQDEETAEMLRGYGVDMAQGFHFGEPLSLAEAHGRGSPESQVQDTAV